jgi:hypothetical protein
MLTLNFGLRQQGNGRIILNLNIKKLVLSYVVALRHILLKGLPFDLRLISHSHSSGSCDCETRL